MADPDATWVIEDPSESAPEVPPPEEGGEQPPPAEAGEQPPPEELPPPPEELIDEQKKKKRINRHWARPKFLQYAYMENYRRNYYDDYINFLDKRNRGIDRDVPRPQTWAERALRTYNTHRMDRASELIQRAKDSCVHISPKYVNTYTATHTKDYYYRKYYTVLIGDNSSTLYTIADPNRYESGKWHFELGEYNTVPEEETYVDSYPSFGF